MTRRAKTTKKAAKIEVVEVLWGDAASEMGWKSMTASKKASPEKCIAVGYPLLIDKRKIILCTAISTDGETNGRFVIPRDWAQRIRRRR